MSIAHLNIGTNLGHRLSNIDRAVALLSATPGIGGLTVSQPVTSEPWGFDSDNTFVNVGVRLDTTLTPLQLLDATQLVEQTISTASHRDDSGNYRDRLIDIDIIAFTMDDGNDLVTTSTRLTIPHPLMHLREFVLIPMSQLAPEWRHPLMHLTAPQLLEALRGHRS